MANFTTRVELHGSHKESDYELLHTEMGKQGFVRTIGTSSTNPGFHLPTAEYNKIGEFSTLKVLELAKVAATKTGKEFSILVTKAEGSREWYNLKSAK
jgi:hypothetical protein